MNSIIYHDDNINESNEIPKEVQSFSQAVGMLVYEKNLKKITSNSYHLIGPKLKERLAEEAQSLFTDDKEVEMPFCDSIKYLEQKSNGFCSGFLIGPKLFITAGHCVSNKTVGFFRDSKTKTSYLENMRVIFNSNMPTLNKKNIYTIKRIKKFKNLGERGDYALLELSDEVKNATPLQADQLDMSDEIKRNDELIVLGHPYGLSLKVSGNAQIIEKRSEVFYSNIDAFPGSSGSMVVNRRTHKVVGLVASGPSDKNFEMNLEIDNTNNCIAHKTFKGALKNREELSKVSKINNILSKDKDLTRTFFDTLLVLQKYYEEYKKGDRLFIKKAKDYSRLEKLYEKLDYDSDLEDEMGETPLYKAIELQNFEMFKFFLKNNENSINKLFKGKPYSLLVLESNNSEFIQYILDLKLIDFNIKFQGKRVEKYFNDKLSK